MSTTLSTTARPAAHGTGALAEFAELSLARCLLGRLGPDVAGVPGWSIAPREALALLRTVPPGVSVAELNARLAGADHILRTCPLAEFAAVFPLAPPDLRLLALVLAPELDGHYATAIGVLQDDLTRRRPGLTLLADLLAPGRCTAWDLRRAFAEPDSPVAAGLLGPVTGDALPADAGYAPAPAVVTRLLAPSLAEAITRSGARLLPPRAHPPDGLTPVSQRLLHLAGPGPAGEWFSRWEPVAGLPLVIGDLDRAGAEAVPDWIVLARLAGAALLVVGAGDLDPADDRLVSGQLDRASGQLRLVATDGRHRPGSGPVLRAPAVTVAERAGWWSDAAARNAVPLSAGETHRLAATLPIGPESIERSMIGARDHGTVRRAARELLSGALPSGARRIEPGYDWDDLVLPEPRKQLLRAIPQHVLHAGRVFEEWGFGGRMPYGRGVSVLFAGPSGCGKTMTAQIIAAELGVELFQVDLSKTVSKYIGETEKNLEALFTAAERAGAVLLFDEADAVFGKRTEVQDAHDMYANVQIAYLLQRMESFGGLAVLTSNMRQGIDDAFVRRLRFVAEFPLPDAEERRRIWDRAFPAGTPVEPGLDLGSLARRLPITGGSIQNIALHAAFLAAADGTPVGSGHLLAATRRELVKTGMHNAERGLPG